MNQSVIRALSLLNLFTEETPELTLKELASKASLPKPTAYRLLTTLERLDYLYKSKENEHDSRYRLGLKLLELGELVSGQLEVRGIALPFMKQLGQEINEVIHLVIVYQNRATYIEKVDSTRPLRLNTRVGKSTPLYIGSGPKLLLAHMPTERQKEIIESEPLKPYKNNQQLKPDELWKELSIIRTKGYAYSVGEQDLDTTGISYPIYDFRNEVSASLTVSGLSRYFEGEHLSHIKEQTKQTALKVSEKLGYQLVEEQQR